MYDEDKEKVARGGLLFSRGWSRRPFNQVSQTAKNFITTDSRENGHIRRNCLLLRTTLKSYLVTLLNLFFLFLKNYQILASILKLKNPI